MGRATQRSRSAPALRSAKIEAAVGRALAGEPAELFDLLGRGSRLPGPRPNLELAAAVGGLLDERSPRADALVGKMLASSDDYLGVVGVMALAARATARVDARAELASLHDLAEDPRPHVRDAVVEALRGIISRRGEAAIAQLASFTDGYLHAHAVLEALADRTLLAHLPTGEEVLARLDEAFELADASARSHERSHGVRALRRGLPGQIAVFAARFPEVLVWLGARAGAKRPETREVVEQAIGAVRRAGFGEAEAQRLRDLLAGSAPPPRDPTRIVAGTRKRSRGRR